MLYDRPWVRLAALPFRLFGRRPLHPPRKALILRPCCISQVMMATPLVAALSEAYPNAQFDWAISEWARPAVISNPRLSELIDTGRVGFLEATRGDVRALVEQLREQQYDTCFVPGRASLWAYIAWRAGIPQRIGLDVGWRGFAHTLAVPAPPLGQQHEADIYLSLARAMGIEAEASAEFYPSDRDRATATERLVDEVDWLGDVPLVIMHPGGGYNPGGEDERKRWPLERYALLGNHLVRQYQARILLVGGERDKAAAATVAGMMPTPAVNMAGRLTLGELGALCEMADLYVGNDTGPTHIAAAVGCPTLAIFGPSDPAVSAPRGKRGRVEAIGGAPAEGFTWAGHVLPAEAIAAADRLLSRAQEIEGERLEIRPGDS